MYSAQNKGKSVGAKRVIRTLKNKIYKFMTSIWKNVYIDKLDDLVNKYDNTFHNTIIMRPVDVKSSTYIDSSKEIHDKHPKFKIDDIVKISKSKNNFAKVYIPNWPTEGFVIKKAKNTVLRTLCY